MGYIHRKKGNIAQSTEAFLSAVRCAEQVRCGASLFEMMMVMMMMIMMMMLTIVSFMFVFLVL